MCEKQPYPSVHFKPEIQDYITQTGKIAWPEPNFIQYTSLEISWTFILLLWLEFDVRISGLYQL